MKHLKRLLVVFACMAMMLNFGYTGDTANDGVSTCGFLEEEVAVR